MFSLIITIISIALVAALALATLYYGGTAFNRGSAGAEAARFINEGQQLNAAMTLYKADIAAGLEVFNDSATLESLTPKYLSQFPAGLSAAKNELTDGLTKINVPLTSLDVCNEINKRAGHSGMQANANNGMYGCYSDLPGRYFFYYYL